MAIRSEVADTKIRECEFVGQARGPSGGPVVKIRDAIAAAGSSNTDATAIVGGGFTRVTAGDGTKGVILPDVENGTIVYIKNNAAAILKLYPHAGAAINALTATTGAISLAANVDAILIKETATQWWTLPLLPS